MDGGRIVLDAPREQALAWLADQRPLYLPHAPDVVARVSGVRFSYGDRVVLENASLEVRRGEIVALVGPNGVGKTTLAQIAAGLLEPEAGEATRQRAAYLTQDPGRHLVTERVIDEVALGAEEDRAWAELAKREHKLPTSDRIARDNHALVLRDGISTLQAIYDDIRADRDRSYAAAGGS